MDAYCGAFLFVDLSTGHTHVEHPSQDFYKKYLYPYFFSTKFVVRCKILSPIYLFPTYKNNLFFPIRIAAGYS